jgi:hypothetical protein
MFSGLTQICTSGLRGRGSLGKLYEIAARFLIDNTERILDFGVCLLRLVHAHFQ